MPIVEGEGARHVVVDSTGIKVYGEGEWKVRQHGYSKRRTWRKLHLGVDEETGEILAAVVSTNNVSDDEAFGDILDGVEEEIEAVSAEPMINVSVMPPLMSEVLKPIFLRVRMPSIGTKKERLMLANQNLKRIEEVGRAQWKQESGNHRRSLSESA